MELTGRDQFTKEQLIELTREDVEFWRERDELIPSMQTAMRLRQAEIALAVLTAPDDIPRPVLDSMSDKCDAGFDAQGIWDLCKAAIIKGGAA